jgi:hypothetical protein
MQTLGKLVHNWQQKEAEKNERMRVLTMEHEQLKVKDSQQMKLITQFETQLSETIAQLVEQQESAVHAEQLSTQRLQLLEKEVNDLRESLAADRDLLSQAQEDGERVRRERDRALSELEETRQQLIDEREQWEEREQEYLQRVQDMTDNHLHLMEDAKVRGTINSYTPHTFVILQKKSDAQSSKIEELKKALHNATLELQQQTVDLEAMEREKVIISVKCS